MAADVRTNDGLRTALQGLPAAGAGTDRSGDRYLPRWLDVQIKSGGRAVHTPGHQDRQVQDMLTWARKTWPKFGSLKVSNTWG